MVDQLRALRVFSAVVGEGSFAGAARALALAPAVVTRTVAELEAHLGARLLQRTTRRLAHTAVGQTYLDTTRRLLLELDEADAQAGSTTQQPRGSLRVLTPPAFAVHQLAPLLPRLRALHPRLSVELTLPGAVDAPDEAYDVSIVSMAGRPLQGDFIARQLARSQFVLCASPGYLRLRGVPAEPEGLLGHEALLPAVRSLRRELTLQHADGRQVTIPAPPPALASGHLEMLLAAAVAGLGIAGLPSFLADAALRDGRLQRVLPEWAGLTLTLYAAMPSRKHLPAATKAFVDFLVQSFGGGEQDPWVAVRSPSPRQRA